MSTAPSSLNFLGSLYVLVQSTGALTVLYPGTDSSHWDVIDLLQVVLYVVLGHSVQTYPEETEKGKTHRRGGREREDQRLCKASSISVCVG